VIQKKKPVARLSFVAFGVEGLHSLSGFVFLTAYKSEILGLELSGLFAHCRSLMILGGGDSKEKALCCA
jgi:hypothetical protein